MSLDIAGVLKLERFGEVSEDLIESLQQRGLELWICECREVSQGIQEVFLSYDVRWMVEEYEVLCQEVESLQEEYVIVCCAIRDVLLEVKLEDEDLREWEREDWVEEVGVTLHKAQCLMWTGSGLASLEQVIVSIKQKFGAEGAVKSSQADENEGGQVREEVVEEGVRRKRYRRSDDGHEVDEEGVEREGRRPSYGRRGGACRCTSRR